MLLLLGILKRNNKYYMNVVNTDKACEIDGYQFINPYILNSCVNVKVQHYLSNKQDPKEYLRGEFDITNLIVDDNKLRNRINDYQIISIYYDEENKPCLYKSIDRAGNISMHDIAEFEYTKRSSVFGDDFANLPSFIERKSLQDAYDYLKINKLDEDMIEDIPVGLARHYLMGVKGFKEGYHTITEVNHGVPLAIHEYMLYNGTATLKLIEYVSKDKNVFLTKQDYFSNPFPKERTVGFLPSPIILLGSKRLIPRFFNTTVNTEYSFYSSKAIKTNIPFSKNILNIYDKHVNTKDVHTAWKVDDDNNIPNDIYKNILPNEIFKMPSRFCRDMKNLPFSVQHSYRLEEENTNITRWMYTVALFICWQYYSSDYKNKLRPIIKDYQMMYKNSLNNLVRDIGPRDTLTVMKWFKDHLQVEMKNILNSDLSVIEDNSCLFSFYQNEFELPEVLRVYSEDTINNYGGVDKLKEDFDTNSTDRKAFIIKTLEKLEMNLQDKDDLEIEFDISSSLKKINKKY